MKIKYNSYPIFKNLSWAITYHFGSLDNPKFYRDCGDEAIYMFDLLCDEEGNEPKPSPEFEVIETFLLDNEVYGRIEINGVSYWTHVAAYSNKAK